MLQRVSASVATDLAVFGIAGPAEGFERKLDDFVVGEASASAGLRVEVVLTQSLEQRVGGVLHHVRVGSVGSRTGAGMPCCAMEGGGVVVKSDVHQYPDERS